MLPKAAVARGFISDLVDNILTEVTGYMGIHVSIITMRRQIFITRIDQVIIRLEEVAL